MSISELLTIEETAQFLRIHKNTAYKWAKTGKLPISEINGMLRIDRNKLLAMLGI